MLKILTRAVVLAASLLFGAGVASTGATGATCAAVVARAP